MNRMGRYIRNAFRIDRIDPNEKPDSVLAVEINHAMGGFFAQMNWCLYLFAYARARSLVPRVTLVSDNYRADPTDRDWFTTYFSYKYTDEARQAVEAGQYRTRKITDFSQLHLPMKLNLSIPDAHEAFFGTVEVNKPFADEVEDFVRTEFRGRKVLGVHYRGTDKRDEAPRVEYSTVRDSILKLAAADPSLAALYIATDEAPFIDYIRDANLGLDVLVREDALRSSDGKPVHIHRGGTANPAIGTDALVNSLLLSRCSALLRCSSFLSAWSSIFNPDAPVYLLNQPFATRLWYPEREIIKRVRPIPE